MKKILGVLLVILMLFAFVACDTGNSSNGGNNGGVTGNTTIDASDLDFDIEVSALPEVTGTDPFANVKTLYGESYVYEYYEYYKVDSENKILTYYSRDTDENGDILDTFSPIYDFSYSYNETENTFSIVIKNLINGDEIIPITNTSRVKEVFAEEINKEIEAGKKIYDDMEEDALEVFADGSDEEKEFIKIYVAILCEQCGLNYSEDDITSENIGAILDECCAIQVVEMIEMSTNYISLMIDDLCSVKQYKIINLEQTTEDEIYVIEAEGIYDESKKWYEQKVGYFFGSYDSGNIAIMALFSNVNINDKSYEITEITDSKIICVAEDDKENKLELTYTKEGSGENTVITVDCGDSEVQLTWNTSDFLD